MPIDTTKDIKPLIKLDWTKQKDSIGFFQKAEGNLPDRYSVTVTTNDTTTDGSDDKLEDIKENAIPTGFETLLYFYEREDDANNSRMGAAFAEDWFLSERPSSPIKVLVSIPSVVIDQELTAIPEPKTLPTPSSEIYFNTFGIEKKLNGVLELLNRYTTSIRKFKGKVQGLDLIYEVNNLSNFINVLSALMKANGHMFSNSRSDLIVFGIDSQYKFLYAQINDGSGFKTLFKGFNKFVNSPVATNQRTVNFLTNFEQMYQIYFKNEKMPMQQFFDEFALNPPSYEMSEAPRKSETESNAWEKYKARVSEQYTSLELEDFLALKNSPEQREKLQDKLDSTANFVGDHVISKLDSISEYLEMGTSVLGTNPTDYISDGVFKQLLNKIPLQSLIAGAMECMGFRGFEFLDKARALLSQTDSFFDNVSVLLQKQRPTLSVPDDFPVVDYMKDLGLQILNGILDAVVNVLIQMLVELIRQLLDACKECALANEDRANRNDAMNFGAFNVADSLLSNLIVGTVSDISSTIYEGTGADEIAAEVLAETEQHAKNPFLLANHIDEDLGEALGYQKTKDLTKQEMQQKIENAKTDFTGYIRASSAVLTPGETGNLLLGCPVGQEATDAITLLLKPYPNLKEALAGTEPDNSKILSEQVKKLWADLGKLIGAGPVLQQIKNITDAMPESAKCLCDADDLAMRTKLLKNKGLSPTQIDDQISKSNDRRQQRLEDLSTMLGQGNPLKHALPEIYCTVIYRNPAGIVVPKEMTMPNPINSKEIISRETGEILKPEVKKGLIEKDHPSLTFLMNQVLDTIYDSLLMTFNQDIDGFLPNLTKGTFIEREIPRTIIINDNGETKLELNPEWTKLVKDPTLNYSYGALLGDASTPGMSLFRYREDGDPSEKMIIENAIGGVNSDDVEYHGRDVRLDWGSPFPIRDRLVAGQMQSGQTAPTAEQEATWENAQTIPGQGAALTQDGRQSPKHYETLASEPGLDENARNARLRLAEYSRLYGYSPIPIMVKEKGQAKFAPGLQEAFASMCSNERLFDITDQQSKYHVYNFQIDNNVFDATGVGNEVQKAIGNVPSSPALPAPPGNVEGADFTKGIEVIAEAFSALASSTYNIDYVVPYSASFDINCNRGWPMNTYATTITLTPEAPVAGSVAKPPFIIYQDVQSKKQETYICQTIGNNQWQYDASLPHIPQEQAFVTWNQKAWQWGAMVYRNPSESTGESDISRGVSGLARGHRDSLKNFLYAKDYGAANGTPHSTYDGLWRDFYCSFTKMISKSPLLDLGKLNSLDLLPMNQTGQDPNCDLNPSLLEVEAVKQRVKDEYGLVQCIEASFPNIDGLGTNKDNPFEKSNLGGAVLLTVRTYVLEVLLRSIFIFYYFRFTSPETVDNLLTTYISQLIKKDVLSKNFLDEFRTEALELYNRNAADLRPPRPQTNDFDEVLEYFVRHQVFAVANRLTKTVGTIGDTSLDSYLLIDQSQTDPAWIPGVDVPAFPGDPDRILKNDSLPVSNTTAFPVPVAKVKELLGDGALSRQTLRKFNWDSPISYLKNLPIGFLMREYFGKFASEKQNIWSKEAASNSPQRESWRWITGTENKSDHKANIGGQSREKFVFDYSNLVINGAVVPDALPIFNAQDSNIFYNYGVSRAEIRGMATLLKMLYSTVDDNTFTDRTTLAGRYVATSGGETYYPGKFLRATTTGGGFTDAEPFTFKYNQVWDRRAWNWTGEEVPEWVKTAYSMPGNSLGSEVVPTDSIFIGPGGSSKNRKYSHGHWYPDMMAYTPADGANYANARWVRDFNDDSASPAATLRSSLLRWITIEGKSIGPWRGIVYPTTGLLAWKLIDPTYSYNRYGQPTTNRSWSDTINRTNTPFTEHSQLAGTGITVGRKFTNPATFGLQATTFDNTGEPENPDPNVNPYSYRLHKRGVSLLQQGMGYLSLLDYDVLTIIELLKWEKTQAPSAIHPRYDEWISDLEAVVDDFKKAHTERKEISINLLKEIQENGVAHEPTPPEANPGKSFENGNFIKEYYLRVEDLDYQGIPETDQTITLAGGGTDIVEGINTRLARAGYTGDREFEIPIAQAKWTNSNYVDKGSRTEFLKGVVNINAFQDYINERFTADGNIPTSIRTQLPCTCLPVPLTKALITDLDRYRECGEKMAKELGVTLPADRTEFVLGDFFGSVHLGVRISYVTPMDQTHTATPPADLEWPSISTWQQDDSQCWRDHSADPALEMYQVSASAGFDTQAPFNNIAQGATNSAKASLYQKAFFVPNGHNWANIVPLVCSEVEIDPLTLMSEIAGPQSNFFENKWRQSYRSTLIPQLRSSPEYKSLFRYLFPVDRMLSLNQIYSSEYLRSYKGVNEALDPTKIRLKDIFITLYNGGNYQAAECTPSSLNLQLGALNGIPWEGLAQQIIIMIAKTVVLIFKGFVEAYDINIAVSKMIRDSIHLVNQMIAQGAVLANTAQQAGAATGDLFSGLGSQACKDSTPTVPPDEWFDPINENFIPEPQIMYISLALLPITLLPLLWPGLPITPFGVAYWGMDWRPEPNWLSSMPPSDWLDKLFSKDSTDATKVIGSPDSCNVDLGLPPPSSEK